MVNAGAYTVDVGNETGIYDDLTTFTNNGTLNTDAFFAGLSLTEGGTYINSTSGRTNITGVGPAVTFNIYGGEVYNNNTSPVITFSWAGRSFITGINSGNKGIFQNQGIVNAGSYDLNIDAFGLLDLNHSVNASRFVMYEGGCATPYDATNGRINLLANEAGIEIASQAYLSADSIVKGGAVNANTYITNNGRIQKIDTSGAVMNCPVHINPDGNMDFDNNGIISLDSGQISLLSNSTFDNAVGAWVEGSGASSLLINDNSVFTNDSNLIVASIGIGDSGGGLTGGTLTLNGNSVVTVYGNLDVGDTGVAGGIFQTNGPADTSIVGSLNVKGSGIATLNLGAFIELNDLYVINSGTLNNFITLDVDSGGNGETHIYDDGATINNDGTLDTYKLFVGEPVGLLDGGTLINNEITNVTYSSGGTGQDSIRIYEGAIINNNTNLGVSSFNYDARMWIWGTPAETGVFQNLGVVDAGEDSLYVMDYGLLDLDGNSRFVMYDTGCSAIGPNNGSVFVRSTTGTPTDAQIDIGTNATFSADFIELSSIGGYINNNGTIDKIDTSGTPLVCDVDITVIETSLFNNNFGAEIDLKGGNIAVDINSTFNNNAGATITGAVGEHADINVNGAPSVFNNGGDIIDIGDIQLWGIGAAGGPTFNALSGSTATLEGFAAGDQSHNVGGTLQVDTGAQLTASNVVLAEGYGEINADGQIDGGVLLVAPGNAAGSALINLNDTSDPYDFNVLLMGVAQPTYTGTLNVVDGAVVNINSAFDVGGGTWVSGGMGGIGSPGGEIYLNLDGTLNIADFPAEPTVFVIGEAKATLTVGLNGFFNYDDVDGIFSASSLAPYGLIDNSNNLATEGIDIEGQCILDGNAELNNRMDCVDLIHVQANGDVAVGLDAVVTVDGSTTTVDGVIELDGIWNAGDLTVNGPSGLIHSGGDDEIATTTNFLINADSLNIGLGGAISSNGVSSVEEDYTTRTRPNHEAGSYGGEGEGRGGGTDVTYGFALADENDIPTYGEAGLDDGGAAWNVDAKGGGGVRIHVTGDAVTTGSGNITIDGTISANGAASSTITGGSGAGGTVIIVHEPTHVDAVFNGSGTITANGGAGTLGAKNAGGGRVIIQSKLLDEPDYLSYDFNNTIQAYPGGANAAAGTIAYTGDDHNDDHSIIVDQNNISPGTAATEIPDPSFEVGGVWGDWEFHLLEARDGAVINIDEATNQMPEPKVCYEVGTGSAVEADIACNPYPNKPDTLFMNTTTISAQGADPLQEPGYQVADGVDDATLVIADLTPSFSVMFRNPDPTMAATEHEFIEIRVSDTADFSNIIWDASGANQIALTSFGGTKVIDGQRTRDIEYNENSVGAALTPGVPYYIAAWFRDDTNTFDGLGSHADYNDQWKFEVIPGPPDPVPPSPPPGGNAGGRPPNYIPPGQWQLPAEEPPVEQPPAEEPPAEEPSPVEEPPAVEPPAEEPPPAEQPPAPEPQPPVEPYQPPVIPPVEDIIVMITEQEPPEPPAPPKVPRKVKSEPQYFEGEEVIPGCTRADITERIIQEFDLYILFNDIDQKCLTNWEHCMLPFLIHTNFDANQQFYFPDVQDIEDKKDVINFATRNRMVQGYYLEEDSPFKPLRNMSQIEIVKLLNFVLGMEWLYEEEFFAQIGGFENLETIFKNASDLEEWWHIRYHNFACELGLVECDSFNEFGPNDVCSVPWLDNMISKYRDYYTQEDVMGQIILDSDNDLISDKDEINIFLTDENKNDTDDDSLDDAMEIYQYKTNPNLPDTDNDNLDDGDEVNIYKTDPLKADTDNDGAPDGIEIEYETDPLDPESFPEDLNGNGIADSWEDQFGLAPNNGTDDADGDGLADILEYRYGTNPLEPDTDGDGLTDGAEVLIYGSDPLEYTNLEDLGVMITNLKDGMILTDLRPFIQGVAPKVDMEIVIILKNEFGHEIHLGNAVTDDQNVFEFRPDFDLRDGEFYLVAKGMDPENQIVHTSKPIRVTMDSSLEIKDPVPERLGNMIISEDVLLEGLTVDISDKNPILLGRTGFKNKVTAVWHSVVGASSIIADISGGEFNIQSPLELPYGSHYVTVYAVRESDQAVSSLIEVKFDIKESLAEVLHEVNGDGKGVNWPLYIFLALSGLVVISGSVWWFRKRAGVSAASAEPSETGEDTPDES